MLTFHLVHHRVQFLAQYSSPYTLDQSLLLLRNTRLNVHLYADGTQSYCPFKVDDPYAERSTSQCIEKCMWDIKSWMTTNKLKLNDEKTELIVVTFRHKLKLNKKPNRCKSVIPSFNLSLPLVISNLRRYNLQQYLAHGISCKEALPNCCLSCAGTLMVYPRMFTRWFTVSSRACPRNFQAGVLRFSSFAAIVLWMSAAQNDFKKCNSVYQQICS